MVVYVCLRLLLRLSCPLCARGTCKDSPGARVRWAITVVILPLLTPLLALPHSPYWTCTQWICCTPNSINTLAHIFVIFNHGLKRKKSQPKPKLAQTQPSGNLLHLSVIWSIHWILACGGGRGAVVFDYTIDAQHSWLVYQSDLMELVSPSIYLHRAKKESLMGHDIFLTTSAFQE